MKNNQHKYQRRARTPVLFQCDKHFIVLYLKCNDLCNYSNITLYCKGLECHTLKSVVKTIGRRKKKGPPLTLRTPGSAAFVSGRIMLFHSADKGKHPFFKAVKGKSFFPDLCCERGAALPYSHSKLAHFRTKHKLIPTTSFSKHQFGVKEDATAPIKMRPQPPGLSQVTTHPFAHKMY